MVIFGTARTMYPADTVGTNVSLAPLHHFLHCFRYQHPSLEPGASLYPLLRGREGLDQAPMRQRWKHLQYATSTGQ